MIRRPPRSTPFPYPTLFRSLVQRHPEPVVIPALAAHPPGEIPLRHERARTERGEDRKSTRLNSSHSQISYAVFCLKKKQAYTKIDDQVQDQSARLDPHNLPP